MRRGNHRRTRYRQHLIRRRGVNRHIGELIGFEQAIGVLERHPRSQGAGFGIKFRVDERHRARPRFARQPVDGHRRRLPHGHAAHVARKHGNLHPHAAVIGNREQIQIGGDVHALAQIQGTQIAGLRCQNRHRNLRRAGSTQSGNLCIGKIQQAQPFARGGGQRAHAAFFRHHEIFLRRQQFGRIQRQQHLTARDRIAHRAGGQLPHPARGAGMHMHHPILVQRHIAHAANRRRERPQSRRRHDHIHVFERQRRDRHGRHGRFGRHRRRHRHGRRRAHDLARIRPGGQPRARGE